MGDAYALSIAFVGNTAMRRLNRTHRKKDKTTDILSFGLSKQSGEIVISLTEAAKRARAFGMKPSDYLPFLFVHGLLHLKGYDHGKTMERLEKRHCTQFKIPFPQRD
jgi:probable rRNA maturation factor